MTGLVGYASYLLVRGLFDRSALEILTGAVVGAVWGGALITSAVPHAGISWQGHVCGAIAGVIAAYLLSGRKQSPPAASPPHPGSAPIRPAASSGAGCPAGWWRR